jgi:histidinol-phosphatase (PHP family)
MWSNLHTHSNYCDGTSSLVEIINSAISKNMISLGFSSHAPLPFNSPWCMKRENLIHYLHEIDQLKKNTSQLQLYSGLEVDYIPGKISSGDFKDQLDFTIGSIHFVESFSDGHGWEIDGTHASFNEGYEHIFKKDIRAAVTRYFELTREMVTRSCPNVIGHLDKIKIQNKYYPYFDESENWYQQEVKHTLDVIRASSAIIEVNTRGLYQKKSLTTYPSPWILQLICHQRIPITLSSDAHHPDDLVSLFPDTAKLLLAIGFKKIRILMDGKWQEQQIKA